MGDTFMLAQKVVAEAKLVARVTVVTIAGVVGLEVGGLHVLHHLHLVLRGLATPAAGPGEAEAARPALLQVWEGPLAECLVG